MAVTCGVNLFILVVNAVVIFVLGGVLATHPASIGLGVVGNPR